MVSLRLPSQLDRYTGGRRTVDVDGRTVGEVLRTAVVQFPDLGVRLFDEHGTVHAHLMLVVGDREVDRDQVETCPIEPGDEVAVLVAVSGGAEDVRMRGFRERATVEAALAAALEGVASLPAEPVPLLESYRRVLAGDVVSGVDVPGFRRATMDGFAVQAGDTFGASAYSPVSLTVRGASMPGSERSAEPLTPGAAMRIMTGAPVPDGADAVLRAEDARETGDRVEVMAPVAEGKNVGRVGEDIAAGSVVLGAGRRLLPQDVGLLSSIGHDPVRVYRRPRVRIIVSGDELLAPGSVPGGNRIVDSNSPMLESLVRRDGGIPEVVRLRDDEDAMRSALGRPGAEVIVTAGAASVGTEDRVPLLVDELGELLVHGVAMRPSSPAGVGTIGGAKVLILPGNPVSCLVAYDFFAGPVIRRLGGLPEQWPYRTIRLPLAVRLVSQIGRTDYARVKIEDDRVVPVAISGASVLSSVTRAAGFVVVPAGLEGYAEGTTVDVHLYDQAQ
jgi:molybdopterin molybdotransferase